MAPSRLHPRTLPLTSGSKRGAPGRCDEPGKDEAEKDEAEKDEAEKGEPEA